MAHQTSSSTDLINLQYTALSRGIRTASNGGFVILIILSVIQLESLDRRRSPASTETRPNDPELKTKMASTLRFLATPLLLRIYYFCWWVVGRVYIYSFLGYREFTRPGSNPTPEAGSDIIRKRSTCVMWPVLFISNAGRGLIRHNQEPRHMVMWIMEACLYSAQHIDMYLKNLIAGNLRQIRYTKRMAGQKRGRRRTKRSGWTKKAKKRARIPPLFSSDIITCTSLLSPTKSITEKFILILSN